MESKERQAQLRPQMLRKNVLYTACMALDRPLWEVLSNYRALIYCEAK